MRPTSDPDSDFHDPDDRRQHDHHDVITDDGDPNPGPWAAAPAHLRDDSSDPDSTDENDRVAYDTAGSAVPGQREPDHDGQLYVGASHPDTDLTSDEAAYHEPVPVDEAGEPLDESDRLAAEHDDELAHDDLAHDDLAHDDLAHDELAHDEPATHDDLADDEPAQGYRLDQIEISHDNEPVAYDEPVADPVAHDETAAPVVAVPVTADDHAEPAADADHDEPAADAGLKPGDVPVSVVAFLAEDAVEDLRQRWREAQLGFVDDPRQAADDVRNLVNEAIEKVTTALHSQREQLGVGPSGDTEHYRVTVQRCRSFFDRLLSL